MFVRNIVLWERKKMLKFVFLEGVGLQKSVGDNYLWIFLYEYNCRGFYLMNKIFFRCLF